MSSVQNMPVNSINNPFFDFSRYFWTVKSNHNLSVVMVPKGSLFGASGHNLPARAHSVNAHVVSAQIHFSHAVMQTMQFLHPSRPKDKKLYYRSVGNTKINFRTMLSMVLSHFLEKLVTQFNRQWWYILGISGMAPGHYSKECRSSESTKNGVSSNLIKAIYQIRRFNNAVHVILSGGQRFLAGVEGSPKNH